MLLPAGCRMDPVGVIERQLGENCTHPLRVEPAIVKWGAVTEGQKRKVTCTVRNDTDTAIVVDRIRTSCDCLKARLSRHDLPPRSIAELSIELDLAKEPRIAGAFRMTVEGQDPKAELLFELIVEFRVSVAPRERGD